MQREDQIKYVSRVLKELREQRDEEQETEVRREYNETCDRLDVLESKLLKFYYKDK